MVNLFVYVNKYQPHSVARKRFLDREEARKYKFRFAPKLPSFCINQKCLMGLGSLHIFYLLNLNGGLKAEPSAFGDFGDTLCQNYPFLGMFQMKLCLKTFVSLCT